MYAIVKDNEILGYTQEAPNVDQSLLHPNKPKILPVEEVVDEFDPISQVQEGPTYEFEETRVVKRTISRSKNEDEINLMKLAKDNEIETVFQYLYSQPITFIIGETEYTFHADAQARENITGILQMYDVQNTFPESVAEPMPDPRPFTPKEGLIMISRSELAALGHAIGVRKDKLYAIKKMKQYLLSQLTDPHDIHNVDPTTGWEIS